MPAGHLEVDDLVHRLNGGRRLRGVDARNHPPGGGREIGRMAALMDDLLEFARPAALVPAPADPGSLLKQAGVLGKSASPLAPPAA